MNLFLQSLENCNEKQKSAAYNSVKYGLRIVLLNRALKVCNTDELPYSSQLDPNEWDVEKTLKMWLQARPVEDLDKPLEGLSELGADGAKQAFTKAFESLKICCDNPQENMDTLGEFDDLKWQFDFTHQPYEFKLLPGTCREIFDQCQQLVEERIDVVFSKKPPQPGDEDK